MGIRDFLFGAPQKASIIGLPATEQPDKPLEKAFDDGTLLSTYRDDAWPYILANKVAEQAAQAPLRIGVPGDDPTEFEFSPPDDPIQQLLDRPVRQSVRTPFGPVDIGLSDGSDFVHLLILYMELVGHAPIEVVRDRRGEAGELWVHNPTPWRIVPNEDRTIRGYLYLLESAQDIAWQPWQMTYLRWPDPNNPWYGQGRIAAVRQEVMAEEYASIRDKKLEKNLGIPPGILTSELPIGEAQARELQMRWQHLVGGYQNAGKVGVLGSKTTYQPVQLNSKDADWFASRSWRLEAMAAAFGIPMPLIRMEGATFSNAEQARAEFWEGTLQPRLNRIARMLTARLLPLLGVTDGRQLRFDYSQIEALGENDLEAAKTANEWSQTGVVSVDEVRARLGLPPHDDQTIGARLIVPGSVSLKSVEDITSPPEPPPALAQPGPLRDSENSQDEPPEPPRPTRSQKAIRDRDTLLSPVRESWKRDLSSYFTAQHGAIMGAFAKKAEDDDLLERVTRAIFAQRFRDRLKRISEAPIGTSLTIGAVDAADLLGIEATFDIAASDTATALLTSHLDTLGVQIANTTNAEVAAIIESGLAEGLTNEQIRAKLSTLFDGYQDWRLDRITRTETAAAYNLGSIAQYRDAGVKLVRVIDGDGDEVCAAANGSIWTLEDAEGTPLGHPNCTRTWIPEADGLLAAPKSYYRQSGDSKRHDELMAALTRPQTPPTINVTIAEGAVAVPVTVGQPTIEVPAPVVNVEPASVKVETPTPQVNVTMPDQVTVKVAEMPTTVRTVERDERGNITRVVES